ncbi:hypothetical protein MSMEI_1771 [Mycolicibacterium smegmatis MC2 155]|uniref:Uncharacterized protein n=1 Tax=Mycolicibacterium smegmatis (strain ATCC 700084 / mc(2)155) TaxID=246196 RepID=I7FHD9_MYCS2|nr:hypothetical protein MSMEI_1771 [Mycolicibacterium smegmatis MC2 155]
MGGVVRRRGVGAYSRRPALLIRYHPAVQRLSLVPHCHGRAREPIWPRPPATRAMRRIRQPVPRWRWRREHRPSTPEPRPIVVGGGFFFAVGTGPDWRRDENDPGRAFGYSARTRSGAQWTMQSGPVGPGLKDLCANGF